MKEFKKKGKLRTQKCFSDAVTFQLMKHTELIAIKKKKQSCSMRTIVLVKKRVLGQCLEREKRHIDTIRRDKKESIALIRRQKRKKKKAAACDTTFYKLSGELPCESTR